MRWMLAVVPVVGLVVGCSSKGDDSAGVAVGSGSSSSGGNDGGDGDDGADGAGDGGDGGDGGSATDGSGWRGGPGRSGAFGSSAVDDGARLAWIVDLAEAVGHDGSIRFNEGMAVDGDDVAVVGALRDSSGDGMRESELMVVDARSGDVRWHVRGDYADSGVPVFWGDLVIGPTSETLVAFERDSGAVVWEHRREYADVHYPVVLDGRVFVSADEGLQALDAATGELLWSDDREHVNPPVAGDGMVYWGTNDELVGSDASTGAVEWERSDLNGISTLVYADGVLFTTSFDGVTALDAATGETRWAGPAVTSLPVAVADGTVLAARSDEFVGLDADTGAVLWNAFDGDWDDTAAPPLLLGGVGLFPNDGYAQLEIPFVDVGTGRVTGRISDEETRSPVDVRPHGGGLLVVDRYGELARFE